MQGFGSCTAQGAACMSCITQQTYEMAWAGMETLGLAAEPEAWTHTAMLTRESWDKPTCRQLLPDPSSLCIFVILSLICPPLLEPQLLHHEARNLTQSITWGQRRGHGM